MKARSSKPRAASPGSKPRAAVQNDVRADVDQAWREFCQLHGGRVHLSLKGKTDFGESEELGYLAARGLDALEMLVLAKHTGGDPYQKKVFRSRGKINFGTFKVAESLQNYLLQNELLLRLLREMVRNPAYLADLREATREDVETRMWVRLVFSKIARLATTLSASR